MQTLPVEYVDARTSPCPSGFNIVDGGLRRQNAEARTRTNKNNNIEWRGTRGVSGMLQTECADVVAENTGRATQMRHTKTSLA